MQVFLSKVAGCRLWLSFFFSLGPPQNLTYSNFSLTSLLTLYSAMFLVCVQVLGELTLLTEMILHTLVTIISLLSVIS